MASIIEEGPTMVTVVIGPNGSGKSALAESIASRHHYARHAGSLIYLATMVPADDAGRRRVAAHRASRSGAGFVTLEAPTVDLIRTHPGFITADDVVLLEDVSNLVANLLFGDTDGRSATEQWEWAQARACERILALEQACSDLVSVTIGGLRPESTYDQTTVEYIGLLNQINTWLIGRADQVMTRCVQPDQRDPVV
jgi:adenosylcobinamide kinase/adenosylcobinamide-phosphate guanylyltransferase